MSTAYVRPKPNEADPTGSNKEAYGKAYKAKVARSSKNERAGKYKIETYRK
jgi:hypothetical protein